MHRSRDGRATVYSPIVATTLISRIWSAGLDLLYPPQCALCRRGGTMLCDGCIAALPPAAGPRCPHCYRATSRAQACGVCLAHPPEFESVVAPFELEGGARELVHHLKYDGLSSLGGPMAALMAGLAARVPFGVVVPVPLHRGRERSRGYNQSALLARRLAEELGAEYDDGAVKRVRATKPLARSMDAAERRAIVHDAFRADPGRSRGRRVLLIDDVVTTGATLDACARALRSAGAAEVRALTFARAP